MKILIIGDKPSRYNKDPNVAFIGARCYNRLKFWIAFLGVQDYELINSHTQILMNEIATSPRTKLTLGLEAHKRLSKAGIPHIQLPHPSGLNRQTNDQEYIENRLFAVKCTLELLGEHWEHQE